MSSLSGKCEWIFFFEFFAWNVGFVADIYFVFMLGNVHGKDNRTLRSRQNTFFSCWIKLTWNYKYRFHFHYSSRKETMELSNQNKHVARGWQSTTRVVYRQSIGTNNFQLTLFNMTRDGIVKEEYMDFEACARLMIWICALRVFRN